MRQLIWYLTQEATAHASWAVQDAHLALSNILLICDEEAHVHT